MSLSDRVALVTGAASGIGRGIARRLAADGASVAVADVRRDPKPSEQFPEAEGAPTDELVVAESDVDSRYVETDTADPDQVSAAVERTVEELGGLDVLVNNAGVLVPGDSQSQTTEEFDRAVRVNLNGYFYTVKYAVPHLRASEAGRVVNISSVNATYGGGGPSYASTKAATVNLTRDQAVELADAGVTANCVLPGVVKTPLQDVGGDEEIARRRAETPLPRLGEPSDVGNAVAFFASDEAEWVTGASLVVDGGYVAGGH
ncbi:MAG: SDR family NAD(P)-dependent oxidoreductase [Halobacteriaceae archaeon]